MYKSTIRSPETLRLIQGDLFARRRTLWTRWRAAVRDEPVSQRRRASASSIRVDDALPQPKPSDHFELVLTNPAFWAQEARSPCIDGGEARQKESIAYRAPGLPGHTSNKQLNFVQNVRLASWQQKGRAVVVVPDNVLFEGGAGGRDHPPQAAAAPLRRAYPAAAAHGHLLRPGRQGQRALLRPQAEGRPEPWTRQLWIYDLRTNQNFTLKQRPLMQVGTWMISWPASTPRTATQRPGRDGALSRLHV